MAKSTGPKISNFTLLHSTISPDQPPKRRKSAAAKIPQSIEAALLEKEIDTLVAAFKTFNQQGRSLFLNVFVDLAEKGVYCSPRPALHLVK
jgi:hypothetical protein